MSWVFNDEVLAVIAAILLISGVFAAVQVLNAGRVVEPFSELGLLGPKGKIADYPRVVMAGQPFRLNVYVGNHEGRVMYYQVLVKVGDRNSTVNATVPLAAEPIMEVRTILAHNSSDTIPVDIVLNTPGDNVRLVFEMWTYNETLGQFTYHGRWNQLWLNVTSGAERTVSMASFLNPELEKPILDGYLAVRRAESNGGDISKMVGLLRKALSSAMAGNATEASDLALKVVSMEPEVSRQGIEAARLRLFTGIGGLAAAATAGVGGYIYLRERLWINLAKFYRNWRLVWREGGDEGLSDVEKTVRRLVKSQNPLSLENLVFSGSTGYTTSKMAKAVFNLIRRGALKLVDPNPPQTFVIYMVSRHNIGFMVSAGLVILSILTVYLSNIHPALSIMRMALGSLFVLFLPGYSLVEALYPRGEELSPLERLALSIGLSLALVPLVGLVLNYTPWGIRLNPIMVSLSLLTLGLLSASAYRKYRLQKVEIINKP
jgi:uncharacterized membrane protein